MEEEPREEKENGEVDGTGNEEDNLIMADKPEELLLRTKYLTDPRNRQTEELKAWASSAPEMKKV